MKKNGFVSTSLIYTFFVIFLLLMIFLVGSYSNIRFLLDEYKHDIKNSFAEAKSADINVHIMVYNSNIEEYEPIKKLPNNNYVFENEKSYCKNNSKISYINGEIAVEAKKKDTCYAYFKNKN